MRRVTIKKIGISVLFFFIFLVVFKYYNDQNKLKHNHLYTIAKVYSYRSLSTHGYTLYYNFSFKGITYESDNTVYSKPLKYINKKVFVMFHHTNPKNCELIIDKFVQDTLLVPPPEGWKFLPE